MEDDQSCCGEGLECTVFFMSHWHPMIRKHLPAYTMQEKRNHQQSLPLPAEKHHSRSISRVSSGESTILSRNRRCSLTRWVLLSMSVLLSILTPSWQWLGWNFRHPLSLSLSIFKSTPSIITRLLESHIAFQSLCITCGAGSQIPYQPEILSGLWYPSPAIIVWFLLNTRKTSTNPVCSYQWMKSSPIYIQ